MYDGCICTINCGNPETPVFPNTERNDAGSRPRWAPGSRGWKHTCIDVETGQAKRMTRLWSHPSTMEWRDVEMTRGFECFMHYIESL